jgi:hypothetical protein
MGSRCGQTAGAPSIGTSIASKWNQALTKSFPLDVTRLFYFRASCGVALELEDDGRDHSNQAASFPNAQLLGGWQGSASLSFP